MAFRLYLYHFRYKSFSGAEKYLEYNYTYEDCVANRKQTHIKNVCGCYSDRLQVPYVKEPDDDPEAKGEARVLDLEAMKVDFCRDVRDRTSQQARINFECHDRLIKITSSTVLDAFVEKDALYNAQHDPDAVKALRQAICPVRCTKVRPFCTCIKRYNQHC